MTPGIASTWVPSTQEWDDAWRSCSYSTFFHGREWAEIWAEYRKGKISPDPLCVALKDGTKILLPFSKEKLCLGLIDRHLSSLAGTFGGWLADVSLSEQQQTILLRFIAERYSNLIWRFNPYEGVLPFNNLFHIMNDETHALNLLHGFDEVNREWTKGNASVVRKARKARKAGVMVRLAVTRDDWAAYFRIYENSLNRWGEDATSAYTWPLFDIMYRHASPNIKLWLAEHESVVIAGALCFYSPQHVVYWHGAALSQYFQLRPVNLLMYEVIRDAAGLGYKWFDFNPSGRLEGVKAFKKSFGAVPIISNIATKTSSSLRILQLMQSRRK
jgi:hypothetical protein